MDVVPVVFGSGKRYLGRSTASACWRTPTWSSGATGCCTCATGFAAECGGEASPGPHGLAEFVGHAWRTRTRPAQSWIPGACPSAHAHSSPILLSQTGTGRGRLALLSGPSALAEPRRSPLAGFAGGRADTPGHVQHGDQELQPCSIWPWKREAGTGSCLQVTNSGSTPWTGNPTEMAACRRSQADVARGPECVSSSRVLRLRPFHG